MGRHTSREGAAGTLGRAQFFPQLSRRRAQQLLPHVIIVDLVVVVQLGEGEEDGKGA